MFSSRSPPYSEHTNVFSADPTAVVLPEHTGINDHPIDLVDDLPSHPLALQTLSIHKKDASL